MVQRNQTVSQKFMAAPFSTCTDLTRPRCFGGKPAVSRLAPSVAIHCLNNINLPSTLIIQHPRGVPRYFTFIKTPKCSPALTTVSCGRLRCRGGAIKRLRGWASNLSPIKAYICHRINVVQARLSSCTIMLHTTSPDIQIYRLSLACNRKWYAIQRLVRSFSSISEYLIKLAQHLALFASISTWPQGMLHMHAASWHWLAALRRPLLSLAYLLFAVLKLYDSLKISPYYPKT